MMRPNIFFVLLFSAICIFSCELSLGEEPVPSNVVSKEVSGDVNADVGEGAENPDAVVDDANAHKGIYKTVDENGRVSFSSSGAIKLDIHEANKITLPVLAPPETKKTGTVYRSITITSPENGTEVRDEEVPVTMTVGVELIPGLDRKRGDRFQFYVNGEAYGKPQSANSITLKNLYRGTYTVHVSVLGKIGNLLIDSKSIEFTVRQHSAINKAPSGKK